MNVGEISDGFAKERVNARATQAYMFDHVQLSIMYSVVIIMVSHSCQPSQISHDCPGFSSQSGNP